MRIVQTSLLGWIDMDHVQLVTPVRKEPNEQGSGYYLVSDVYLMMSNAPVRLSSEWICYEVMEDDEINKLEDLFYSKFKAFLLAWRDN